MGDVVTFVLNQHLATALVLGIFGVMGLIRGVRRELYLSAAIALAMLVVTVFGSGLTEPVNRSYRMLRFVREGGLSAQDTGTLQEIRVQSDLIDSPRAQDWFRAGIFGFIVVVGYLVGERFGGIVFGLVSRLLGFFVGLFNGFGITYFLLPIIFPEPRALIEVPTGEVQEALVRPELLVQMAILFVFVMIAFGLYSATGRARRQE